MFVEDLLKSIKGDNLEVRNDDDRVDRLNYRWTVVVLIIFAALVTAETYLMADRINCWVPAHFKGAWEDYVNDYCWIRNTYYLPWDEHVPLDVKTRAKYPIVYYQWVPLFMLIQAMFFYMPIMIWRTLNHRTGVDVNDIVETAEQVQHSDDEELRTKWKMFLTQQIHRYLGMSKEALGEEAGPCSGGRCNCKWFLSMCCFCCMGRRFGNYMSILYLVVKFLFIVNVIGQIFILNWFLGKDFSMYGIRLIQSWMSGESLDESPYFPRVTFCDVEVRRLGNIHRYSVQCVLPINMFNEKVYAFLWFWFAFIAMLSVFNFITWFLRIILRVDSYRYIKKRLTANTEKYALDISQKTDRDRIAVFVDRYLRSDGVLVLRLVDYNTNKVTAEDLITALWKFFLKKKYSWVDEEEEKEKKRKQAEDKQKKTEEDDQLIKRLKKRWNEVDSDDDEDTDQKKPIPSTPGSSTSSETDNLLQPSAPV